MTKDERDELRSYAEKYNDAVFVSKVKDWPESVRAYDAHENFDPKLITELCDDVEKRDKAISLLEDALIAIELRSDDAWTIDIAKEALAEADKLMENK